MGLKTCFLDTYALYEIITGNPNYDKYKKVKAATTRLNLMELYYIIGKQTNARHAEKFYNYFLKFVIDIDDETIKEATQFRIASEKNFSYVDCIGYLAARKRMMKFLTGDHEFKDMEGVEYIK